MRIAAFALVLWSVAPSVAAAQPPSVPDALRELRDAREAPDADEALERAAGRMLQAVDADPDHAGAIIGLGNAAHALAALDRWQSAEAVWQRVIAEGVPRLARSGDEQLTLTVADAYEQLARRAARRGEWDRAANRYRMLCDSALFTASAAPGMPERVERALDGAAHALEQAGDGAAAARYLQRAAARSVDRVDRLDHAAELLFDAGEHAAARRLSRQIIDRFGGDGAATTVVVRAHDRVARALAAEGADERAHRDALAEVVAAYERTGAAPGSESAKRAARAALALADGATSRFRLRGASPRARARAFERALAAAAESLAAQIARYEQVFAYRRVGPTIAATVAIGDHLAALADAVDGARVPEALRREPAAELRCRALRRYEAARGLAEQARTELPATARAGLRAAGAAGLAACAP